MSGAEMNEMLGRAVQAHERGDLETAQRTYRKVLELVPDHADALHLLGVIADQQGRHEEAVALIGRAIAASPGAATFHGNLGTALLALGRSGQAEAAYREALRLDPAYIDGRLNLANLLLLRGDADEALLLYAAAVKMQPSSIDARLGLVAALIRKGRAAEAVPHVSAAVQLNPASARTRDLAGTALRLSRQPAKAVMQHRQAVALAPDDLGYRENLATALVKSGKPQGFAEAIREFEAVLARQPDRLESLIGIGTALVRNHTPLAAMPYFERALAISSDRIEPLVNYSVPLTYAGRFEEALECCEKAMRIAPDDCLVLTHRGTVREYIGDYAGALADYAAARQATGHREPETLADAEFKLGLLLLASGRLAEGWPLYRARMSARNSQAWLRVFETMLPRWDGIVRPDQRMLVWGEQGLGDQIIYASMLLQLRSLGANLTFLCDRRLIPLFARSLSGIQLEPLEKINIEHYASLADVQIGLGDLGTVLRPGLDSFPPATAYLTPSAEQVAAFRRKYGAHGKRLIVGLTWRSKAPTGMFKSASLLDWAPVLQQQDVLFVDLQYGDTAEERRQLREQLGVEILHDDQIDPVKDIDGFAAQAAAMDLVIGGSNSAQHIAAAAGQHCWIAVPGGLGRLWYWFLDRADSPWYPHMRLFRQKPGRYNDWDAPIADIAAALRQRLEERRR